MMRANAWFLLLSLGVVGCAAGDEMNGDWADGEAGKADDLRDSGTVFFVYDNQRVCVTAPCPSYTAITPGGVRFDVARVVADDTAEAESALPLVADGGVLVRGAYLGGSTQPGSQGPGIFIESPIEQARSYLVHRHSAGHSSPYAVLTANAINHEVDRIDMEGYVPSALDADQTLATLVTGQWATKGFVARGDTGETVLYATTGVADSMPCAVRPSGIECVTWPCPEWSLETLDGDALGYASRVELGYLHLADSDEAAVEARLRDAGGSVYGWLAPDAWHPTADDVMVVVDVIAYDE